MINKDRYVYFMLGQGTEQRLLKGEMTGAKSKNERNPSVKVNKTTGKAKKPLRIVLLNRHKCKVAYFVLFIVK